MTFAEFQEELQKLKLKIPRAPTHSMKVENADYGDYLYQVKNAHYTFDSSDGQNLIYIFDSFMANDSCDGDYIIESSNIYDSVDTVKCNNCAYMVFCARCIDSYFCYDCRDSSNLFGCVYLKHKQHCIFNKQYTKEEYEKKVQELLQRPIEENFDEMRKLLEKFPRTQTLVQDSKNCDYGNQVFFGKNCYLCFDSAYSQDSAYLYDSHRNKFCFDAYQSHRNEWVYDSIDVNRCNNSIFLQNCQGLVDSAFSEECYDGNHLFGCVGLKQQEYCILNKKYSKEDYERIVKVIMESFKKSS